MPFSLTPNKLTAAFCTATLLASAVALTGCSADYGNINGSGLAPTSSAGPAMQGRVHGGQQAVVGAVIQLWGVGTTGYGSAATPLISSTVTTDQNGGFNILGDYNCPTSNLVYITAAGGNPGAGTNSASTLVAALGSCSALKTAGNSAFIYIDEITTVAAVWALQGFAGSTGSPLSANATTPSDNFGTTAGNTQGLTNAMNMASVLASTTTGLSPGQNTSGNQINVEFWQVNTIADILAACINTNGPTVSPATPNACNTLFTNTNNATDTFQAALYMARNPGLNVSTLAALSSTTAPFQPVDTSINDFSIGVGFKTGTLNSRWIAFDSFGNAWITSSGAGLTELDPTGNPITTITSYTPIGGGTSVSVGTSYEVAVDTANNAWFTDENNHNIVEVVGSTSAGGAPGAATYTASGATGLLEGIAIDGSNNIWASPSSGHLIGLLSGAYGTPVSGATTASSPFGIAVDLSNQTRIGNKTVSNNGSFVYALNSGDCAVVTEDAVANKTGGSITMAYTAGNGTTITAGAATPLSTIADSACSAVTGVATSVADNSTYTTARHFMAVPYGIAFDNANDMWVVNQGYTSGADNTSGSFSLTKLSPQTYTTGTFTPSGAAAGFTFTSIPGTTGGLNAPYYLAIDGAGSAWVANSAGAAVSAFTNSGTNISPASGLSGGKYIVTTPSAITDARGSGSPRGIAVDIAGNVWFANTATPTGPIPALGVPYVTVLVGSGTPTVMPLSLGIKNGTLGTSPQ